MDLKTKLLTSGRVEELTVQVAGEETRVYFRRMNGIERDVFLSEQRPKAELPDYRQLGSLQRLLLALTLCDEIGTRLFSDGTDVGVMDSKLIDTLSAEAARINGFSKSGEEDAKKNS